MTEGEKQEETYSLPQSCYSHDSPLVRGGRGCVHNRIPATSPKGYGFFDALRVGRCASIGPYGMTEGWGKPSSFSVVLSERRESKDPQPHYLVRFCNLVSDEQCSPLQVLCRGGS